jgi:recombination protein RecA
MAVTIVSKNSSGNNSAEVMKAFKKSMGDSVAHQGNEITEVRRIPTGIFALDLATGGGIPRKRISIVWGAESSSKTAISYLLMAQVQREGQKAVYIDLEKSFSPDWASKFGLNVDDLIVLDPQYAEQAVDMVEAMLCASDVGIVVVDSVAAMTTDNEIASSAEKMNVGGNSYIVGKMIRKAVNCLNRDNEPSLFLINQSRIQIGKMFGDPTCQPGGNSLKFASSMTLRLYGKPEIVKEVHPQIPTFNHITGTIQKAKVPVTSRSFEFDLTLLAHGNMEVGMSPAWNFVASRCKDLGILKQEKLGKPWVMLGVEAPNQKELRHLYETDKVFMQKIHDLLIVAESGSSAGINEIIDTDTGEVING